MTIGFVVTEANWPIVESGLPSDLRVAFVSHEPQFPRELVDHHQPRALVVESLDDFLTPQMVEEADRCGLVLAALITHSTGETFAVDRGVGHLVRQPSDLHTLLAPQHAITGSHASPKAGLVVGVWGAAGSPGRTTMALTLGSLARSRGFPVMVVDADPRGGTIASAWGLLDEVPGFLACARLAGKGILNATEVNRLASRYDGHSGVIDVLTGVSRVVRESELERDSVSKVIDELRHLYSLVLVDVGSDLPSGDSGGLERSTDAQRITSHLVGEVDHVVAVIDATPAGITRFARAQEDLSLALDHDHLTYLLNGVDRSRRALKEEAVIHEALWRFAGLRDYFTVPRDDSHARQALTRGVSLVDIGAKTPIVMSLEPVVDELCRGLVAPPTRSIDNPDSSRAWTKPPLAGLFHFVKKLAPLR
jgi:MinD-like ATPase involved in chromosome partitioning or flagellar assembly